MSLGMLVDGKWSTSWNEHDREGQFKRMATKFRGTISKKEANQKNRLSLYVSYGCPWAHRVIMAYELLRVSKFVSLIVVEPHISNDGWYFSDRFPDENFNLSLLRDLYLKADSKYTGRVTVPVLWDNKEETIINNESNEILKILDDCFNEEVSLFPQLHKNDIDSAISMNYEKINNAFYRTGFAKSQSAYEKEVRILFKNLKELDNDLSNKEFLVGDLLTAADLCLLPSLLRFKSAYYSLFKCNLASFFDFENIVKYTQNLMSISLIQKTFKEDHVKSLYYKVKDLNPSQVIPLGSY